MPYGLYISAEGAHAQAQRLDVIANNLANVETPGFKRELAVFQARYAEAIQRGTATAGSGTINDIGGGVKFQATQTDFSPAQLKRTQQPTDVAISGEGFFMVRKGQENLLTRAGNFRLTAEGDLVTQQGYPVLGDGGSPITITPGGGRWDINASGVLMQAGNPQRLAIVKPGSLGDLVKTGENLFRSTSEVQPVATGERAVASGYVEVSGVQPTTEMTAMIDASRLFEANVNLMKAQDQMLGGLISRVLKV